MKKQEYQIRDTRKRELEFHACNLVLYMYCLANESGQILRYSTPGYKRGLFKTIYSMIKLQHMLCLPLQN